MSAHRTLLAASFILLSPFADSIVQASRLIDARPAAANTFAVASPGAAEDGMAGQVIRPTTLPPVQLWN